MPLEWFQQDRVEGQVMMKVGHVAVYRGERLIGDEKEGTVILTNHRLYYAHGNVNYYLPLDNIAEIALRSATLTKSPKMVLLVELLLLKCAVCEETTIGHLQQEDNCAVCGSKRTWKCAVCEYEHNEPSHKECVECGNQTTLGTNDKQMQVYMLSFRKQPPDTLYNSLSTLLNIINADRNKEPRKIVGVNGLLESHRMESMERDFAIATLGSTVDELAKAIPQLISLAREFTAGSQPPIPTLLDTLKQSPGIHCTFGGELESDLETFIRGRMGMDNGSTTALLLTDLYCYFNRAMAWGLMVSVEHFVHVIERLHSNQKIKLRVIDGIKFVQSVNFNEQWVLEWIVENGGNSVFEVGSRLGIPHLLAHSIVNDLLQRGSVVVDGNGMGEHMFYENIFLDWQLVTHLL